VPWFDHKKFTETGRPKDFVATVSPLILKYGHRKRREKEDEEEKPE